MRSRLRLFAAVGVLATLIDIGGYLVLRQVSPWWLANALALTVAACASYILNRDLTFRRSPDARWVSNPIVFASTAVVAGAVDLSLVGLLESLAFAPLLSKAAAVAPAAAVRWFVYRWVLFSEVRRNLAQRVNRPHASGAVRVSVVVPAYNEEGLIVASIGELEEFLATEFGGDHEIVVVDDGSPDNTALLAERAGATVVRMPENRGKGAAVRAGVLAAQGRSVVFTDADLSYPPQLVAEVVAQLEDGWDIVVGSRRHEDTNTLVKARRLRQLGGRLVNHLTHLVLLGHFRDTQCGIKGFQGDIGKAVFQRTRIDGFAFDVELFLIAEQDQLSLNEIPVMVENRGTSSVNVTSDFLQLFSDLVRIRRWVGSGEYRPTAEHLRLYQRRARSDRSDLD